MVMMIILMVMYDGGNMLVFSLILACFTAQQWTKLTSLAIQDEFLMHNLLAYLNLFTIWKDNARLSTDGWKSGLDAYFNTKITVVNKALGAPGF